MQYILVYHSINPIFLDVHSYTFKNIPQTVQKLDLIAICINKQTKQNKQTKNILIRLHKKCISKNNFYILKKKTH